MPRAIVLSAKDNVATLIDPGKKGDTIVLTGQSSGPVTLASDVPYGHKCATREIKKGADLVKYGHVIGRATATISPGEHVHVHNVESLRARGDIKGGV
jgi:altronate dehydratase small subunit